jgi:hypothetical protein
MAVLSFKAKEEVETIIAAIGYPFHKRPHGEPNLAHENLGIEFGIE